MYSEEQVALANKASIMSLVQNQGMPFEKAGNEYHIRGYGGLYVNPEKNVFSCFSRTGNNGKTLGGRGALSFATQILGFDFKSAMKMLSENQYIPHISDYRDNPKELPEKPVFTLPPRSDNTKQTFAYLMKTRKLSADIINDFMKKGLLYQTFSERDGKRHENGVFLHINEQGKPCGAELFGLSSYTRFKMNLVPDESDRGFIFVKGDKPKTVYLFESAIDLMSFVQLHPEIENAKFVSMSGLKPTIAAHYTEDSSVKVISCVDNDSAGKAFNRRICIGKIENALKDESTVRRVSSGDPPIDFYSAEKNGRQCFYFAFDDDYRSVASSDENILKNSSCFVWKNTSSFEINHECADFGVKDFNEILVSKAEEKKAVMRFRGLSENLGEITSYINQNMINSDRIR